MGTVAYMSPEQVRGEAVDARSDIFSFGQILYEMLAGKRAFEGATTADLMAAILHAEPPELSATHPQVPSQLEKIVLRCLEKNAERRFQSVSDLGFALSTLPMTSSTNRTEAVQTLDTSITTKRSGWRERIAWLLAAGLLLGMLGFAWAYFTRQPEAEMRVFKTSLLPPDKSSFESFAVSPDGKWLAFTAATGAKVQLWVRALDAMEARALPGTEGAFYPFWSPDSRFIGFFVPGKLKKVEASGGPVQTVCDLRRGTGGAWNRDGVILFGESVQSLSQVSAAGGPVTTATTLDPARQESVHYGPSFLPDGRHFLYYIRSTQKDVRGIYLGSLDGKVKQRLLGDDSNVVYVAARAADRETGYLLYQRAGALLAQPFDARQRQLTGEPFPVAEAVARSMPFTSGYFSASDNGVLIFDPNVNKRNSQLLWVDRSGKQMGSVGTASSRPWLSPDEKHFVADRRDPQTALSSLWMADVSGANATPFTFGQTNDQQPIWSPDGNRIVWASSHTGVLDLYQKAASGDGQDELLYKSDEFKIPCDWSRDGRFLTYISRTPKTRSDLWVIPVGAQSGNPQPFPFLQTEADEGGGRLSPNGEWLAYVSDESGRHEVYVERFPAHGGKRQLSTAGGSGPIWRRDGKELFYQAADGKVMAVAVEPGAEFKASTPVALFEFRSGNTANLVTNPSYTVTGDGQRFLLNALVETKESAPLTVVTNWMAEMKK
jgi:Tol biopolymer transport system component